MADPVDKTQGRLRRQYKSNRRQPACRDDSRGVKVTREGKLTPAIGDGRRLRSRQTTASGEAVAWGAAAE